jgi:hypothetical protein
VILVLGKPRLSRRGRTHNFRALRLLNLFVVYAERYTMTGGFTEVYTYAGEPRGR